jgi:alpha-mannosidase
LPWRNFSLSGVALGQTMKAPDITKEPTLYVVPYAHLDTQWRWEFPQTISEYLFENMRINFDYIDLTRTMSSTGPGQSQLYLRLPD